MTDINSQEQNLLGNQIGGFLYFGGHFGFKMATIANQTMDINSQHHNLLRSQISPKSEDFCILATILYSKWSPYGTACLTPCKYPFPLKSFNFLIFNNLF